MSISAMNFHLQILRVSGIKGIPPYPPLGVPCAQWQHKVQKCYPQDKCAMKTERRNCHSSWAITAEGQANFEGQT